MTRWPRSREAMPLEPRVRVNPRLLELQTAKKILAEIFILYRYSKDIWQSA
jgi:hypothetical protein